MAGRLDIVVFGATGFTGNFTVQQLYKLSKVNGRRLTWGIAGRSKKKLKDVLDKTATKTGGNDLNSVPILIADVDDEESIRRMTASARVIINCCGPYLLHGEIVVQACIETGTHHVDVTAESLFIERVELKYSNAAQEKGVYIVSACGALSIPTDLGLMYLENNFRGTINSVETFLYVYETHGNNFGPIVNYGSYESAINIMASYWEMLRQRKKLYPKPLPKFKPLLSSRIPFSMYYNKWVLPFPTTDEDVMRRSQRYFYENNKKRPIQTKSYVQMDSFVATLVCIFLSLVIAVLSQFKYGRDLLLRHPKFFTGGFASHEKPSEDVIGRTNFSIILRGEGWSEKLSEIDDQYESFPNKVIEARIYGVNPAYNFTSTAVTLCAIMILTETKKLPARGGVYTTAAAFSRTSLVQELQKAGTVFEIISIEDL